MIKKRIFMVSPGPNYNIEYTLRQRCERLSDNYRGVIITSGSRYESAEYGEFKVICFRDPLTKSFISTFVFFFSSIYLITKAIFERDKYQLYITYDPLKTGLIGALVAPLFGVRLLVEVNGDYMQDIIYASIPNFYRRQLKKWMMVSVEKFVLDRASGIKCLYKGQVDAFKPFKHEALEANFPDYVNGDCFKNLGETKEVLFAGFPFLIKGVDILIEAFKAVADKHKDWKLKILGYYPDMTEMNTHIDNHQQIYHHPAVDASEMPEQIGRCGIFVLPSRTEAMGRVLIEAMAAGKPRIGSKIGGIPTTIENNVDGLLFEMGNAPALSEQLDRLMSDASLRKELGDNARARYESEFTSQKYFAHLNDFYMQVIS